jgi:hypothetical protein
MKNYIQWTFLKNMWDEMKKLQTHAEHSSKCGNQMETYHMNILISKCENQMKTLPYEHFDLQNVGTKWKQPIWTFRSQKFGNPI